MLPGSLLWKRGWEGFLSRILEIPLSSRGILHGEPVANVIITTHLTSKLAPMRPAPPVVIIQAHDRTKCDIDFTNMGPKSILLHIVKKTDSSLECYLQNALQQVAAY
jgi:hypothetical protein